MEYGISVTGSLGLLKSLYLKKIIKDKEQYGFLIEELSHDLFISQKLIKWALDVE